MIPGGAVMKKLILLLLLVLAISVHVGAAEIENTQQHTVVKGDTLWSLSSKYETTITALLALNPNITPDNLQVGQKLIVPVEPIYSYHVVQNGDNVHSLAQQYQVPLEALIEANGIKNNKVTVGEMIRIPIHLRVTERPTHVVEIGDTLYKIAKQYGVSITELVKWNNINNINTILAGQTLIVG